MNSKFSYYKGERYATPQTGEVLRTDPSRIKALEEFLEKNGMHKIVAEFSGGHDEGGVESITAYSKDYDAEFKRLCSQRGPYNEYYIRQELDKDPAMCLEIDTYWHQEVGTGPEDQLKYDVACIMEAPVQDEWGSFAGEFSVQGEVWYTKGAGRIKMNGSQSVETWDSFGDEDEDA